MSSLLIRGGTIITAPTTQNSIRGSELARIITINNGFLFAVDGVIHSFGKLADAPGRADEIVDATGRFIIPCWCDSHTHLVFAKTREEEFVNRIKGMSYEEIAANGGGILNSAARLREMPESLLFEQASIRLNALIALGTGAVEIKSGYGLTLDSELKMLRVIRKLKETFPIPVKSTFLGAHAIPLEYKSNREGYLKLLTEEMLPKIADEGLAEYIDVFCDRGFFDISESERVIDAGVRFGLKPKIHVSELANIGGVQLGIEHNAISVDHLECAGDAEIEALSNASTIATLLPSCAFFLSLEFPPARKLIDAGAAVALATDFNPGTSPSGNMSFVISLACIKMRMLPEEAISAATANGAFAIESGEMVGTFAPGKLANVIVTTQIPSLAFLPYSFGNRQLIEKVFIRGVQF